MKEIKNNKYNMIKKYQQYIKENSVNITTPFSSFNAINRYDYGFDNKDDILKHHIEWIKKYPILKKLDLESDYIHDDKKNVWIYNSINKKENYNIFLEIQEKDTWSLSLEIELYDDDKEYNKSFEKNGLNYEELNTHLRRASIYIEDWLNELNNK